MRLRYIALICAAATLSACGTNPIEVSDKHLLHPLDLAETKTDIPQPVMGGVLLPPPKPATKVETYSVVVANVPAQEILFALARDAKINLDIHTGIRGSVTINAIKQTLPQILARIAKQVDMRYEIENGALTVMPDFPYLHTYKIDYVNMERNSESIMLNTTQVGANDSNNSSKITIQNDSKNHFWKTLVANIEDILHETDREAASVIANPENGLITVRATEKQHGNIQEFIDQVMNNARRQVLIEATIVEVRLSDNY